MKKLLFIVLLLSASCSGNTIDLDQKDPSAKTIVAKGSMALLLGGLSLRSVIDALEKGNPISLAFGTILGWSSYWFGKSAQDDCQRKNKKS